MDVAQKKCGDWMIVKLGDGQVAGPTESFDVNLPTVERGHRLN
jgi:hypothetical protein